MSQICEFLGSLVTDATASDHSLRVIGHGEGFAVGGEARGWVTLIPPIKVTTKAGRVFFDAQTGSARLKYRRRDDGKWRVYLDLYHGRSDRPAFQFIMTTSSASLTGLLHAVDNVADESAVIARKDNAYIRYPAALSFFALSSGHGGGQIADGFRTVVHVIKRYPRSAERLHALAVRAQETLFAELKQKAGFSRAAPYEDPMEMPSPFHASRILGIAEDSPPKNIREAFREMAWVMHPTAAAAAMCSNSPCARDVMLKGKGA